MYVISLKFTVSGNYWGESWWYNLQYIIPAVSKLSLVWTLHGWSEREVISPNSSEPYSSELPLPLLALPLPEACIFPQMFLASKWRGWTWQALTSIPVLTWAILQVHHSVAKMKSMGACWWLSIIFHVTILLIFQNPGPEHQCLGYSNPIQSM